MISISLVKFYNKFIMFESAAMVLSMSLSLFLLYQLVSPISKIFFSFSPVKDLHSLFELLLMNCIPCALFHKELPLSKTGAIFSLFKVSEGIAVL